MDAGTEAPSLVARTVILGSRRAMRGGCATVSALRYLLRNGKAAKFCAVLRRQSIGGRVSMKIAGTEVCRPGVENCLLTDCLLSDN